MKATVTRQHKKTLKARGTNFTLILIAIKNKFSLKSFEN